MYSQSIGSVETSKQFAHPYFQSAQGARFSALSTGSAQVHSSDAGEDPTILSSDIQFKPDSAGYIMHSALADLVEAEKLMTYNVSVEGTFFIEIIAGECIFTFGVLLKRVPCLKP